MGTRNGHGIERRVGMEAGVERREQCGISAIKMG